MRPNYWISLVLAIGLGLGAIFFGSQWLNARAASDKTYATMVVATRDLAFGDRINAVDVKEVRVPLEALPPGAFKSVADMALEKEPRSALQAVLRNEAILATRITGPEQKATLSAIVEPGMRALSIRVNDVVGVGGFVLPNDRVDVILVRPEENRTSTRLLSDILLQNIRVLGIDQLADAGEGKPMVAKAVTLEVTPEQAQMLSLASQAGTLTLSLRNASAGSEPEAARTITQNDLSKGLIKTSAPAVSEKPKKARPRQARARPAQERARGPSVTLVRGDQRTQVEVSAN